MARRSLGPAVADGQVLYTSPSALKKSDPNDPYGCPRMYHFRYVQGIKEPMGEAAEVGTQVHAEIESYLKTGEKALGAIATSALQFIPEPSSALLVEQCIPPDSGFRVEGIPVVMYIDCVNRSGRYTTPTGDTAPSAIEVIDWKTKGNIDYGLTGTQLLTDTQMVTYGTYIGRGRNVRLSHVYMQTKGRRRAKKSTVLARPKQIAPHWEYVEGLARTIKDIAAEPDISKVPGDFSKCGRCFYKNICPKTNHQTIEQIFGKASTMTLLPDNDKSLDVTAHLAALEAEDSGGDPRLSSAVEFIETAGLGFPELVGDAAAAYAKLKGWDYTKGAGYVGVGRAGGARISTVDDLVSLAKEVAKAVGKEYVQPLPMAPVLPPDAPASDPDKAADPVEGWSKPEAPKNEAQVKQATTGDKPPFAKMKKPELKDQCEALWDELQSIKAGAPEVRVQLSADSLKEVDHRCQRAEFHPTTNQTTGPCVYVDCFAIGVQSLDPYVDGLCAKLCELAGAEDIRCAPQDGPLGFGKWKGALAALVRENPPEAGAYLLDTRGSEIKEIVAEALGQSVVARGIR